MHPAKATAAYVAAGLSGLLALAALNVVADHFPGSGFDTLRNYLTRRNG